MATFRVEKTQNYTVMSNYHLRDTNLSLKAKGLLSQMLSLPENWDYTLSGLAHINKEGKDAIRATVRELEQAGYIQRRQTTDEAGRFGANEYVIREVPLSLSPSSENPTTDIPSSDSPSPRDPTQLNTDLQIKEKRNTDPRNIDSFPSFQTVQETSYPMEANRRETNLREMNLYRDVLQRNVCYDTLLEEYPTRRDELAEIMELMVETVCSTKPVIRVAGNDFPAEVVKSRLLKLTDEHLRYVLACLRENTTKVRCIKQYLLTVLYNAPTTIDSYYAALVNHDMAQGPPLG